jgi:GNAT superfamily N-acetyltransferase
MEIRIATTPEEMEQVYRLRYQCYIEELRWKYDLADGKAKELRDSLDGVATIYYAMADGRMVATFSAYFAGGFELPVVWRQRYGLDRFAEFPESSFSFSSRLMVLPDFRGSTLVPRILMQAYEEGWRRGTRFNFCWCRPRLIELYERLGFIRYKDNILDPAQGYMAPMVMLNEDAEHLRAVRSPFLKICLAHRPCGEAALWFDTTFPGCRETATQHLLAPEDFWQRWAAAMDSAHVTLLHGLSVEQVRALLAAGTVLRCRAGDTVLREGEAGHEMFLILEGVARISKRDATGAGLSLGTLVAGEVFGEMALVSRVERTASVVAETEMQVLVISQEFLHRAMKALPDIAMRMLYNLNGVLSEKLHKTTKAWIGAQEKA